MNATLNNAMATLLVTGAMALASSAAFAHVSFFQKDAYLTSDGRSYKEGTSAALGLNLSHACSAATGTQISTVVFPNGADNEVYELGLDPATLAVTADPMPSAISLGEVLTGDAVSDMKAETDRDWEAIVAKQEAGKVRALHWYGGFVPDEQFKRVTYRASFARFKPESCVSKVRVYIPSSQYCSATAGGPITASRWWAWAAVPEAGITANPIPAGFTKAVGFASYVDLDRDLDNNPLPRGCGGERNRRDDDDRGRDRANASLPGTVIGIYPSVTSLRTFGPHVNSGPFNPSDCPPGYVLVHDMKTMTNVCVVSP